MLLGLEGLFQQLALIQVVLLLLLLALVVLLLLGLEGLFQQLALILNMHVFNFSFHPPAESTVILKKVICVKSLFSR